MIKLLQLIDPRILVLEVEEKELPEEFTVSERGYEFLKQRVAALNKKATKYKVPPIEIKIIKEEMVKVLRPEITAQNKHNAIQVPVPKSVLDDPNSWTQAKQFTLKIEGKPPQIEGYEFIARLEHTPAGNFVYTNPKSSVPNLPAEFKSMNQHCDVCHTNRERNDTFVIKMEQADPTHFPGKLPGELLIVGRNCLQRFMPGMTSTALVAWTKMVDNIQDDLKAAGEMEEGGEGGFGGGGKYYEDPDHLLKYLVGTYLQSGFYISKKQAKANYEAGKTAGSESTLSRALGEMRGPNAYEKDPAKNFPVWTRLKNDEAFLKKVEGMMEEFTTWVKSKDFDAMALQKPDFADFFSNLKLVAAQDYLRGSHFGFYSALFQLFLRDKGDLEKKKEAAAAMAALPPSPVTFNETLIGKRLRDVSKETEIKRLAAGGYDDKAIKKAIRGKEWGWEVTCQKVTEYEKTNTFSYGDSGIGYRVNLRDTFGNDFLWFASADIGFKEGNKYIIDGTITRYDPMNKYSNKPQTIINRVKIIKDYANPDALPQSEVPETPPA